MPSMTHLMPFGPVCGIDEAGRGPWAGPVLAAAVILPKESHRFLRYINDSKKLSAKKREALFHLIMETCYVGIGHASVTEIDTLNILQATMLAMSRAFSTLPVQPVMALVDGNRAPLLPCHTRPIIGGDARHKAIGAASIIAKVTRDRLMQELCDDFPGYNWKSNAGYGTKCHQQGLTELGPTIHHRQSFAPIRSLMK